VPGSEVAEPALALSDDRRGEPRPAPRRTAVHLLVMLALLAGLGAHSWMGYLEHLQQRLRLEAIETVQMADALTRSMPQAAAPRIGAQGRAPQPADQPQLQAPQLDALRRELAGRLADTLGTCRLQAPDGRVLLERGSPSAGQAAAAGGLAGAWMESRSHSPVTGMSSVSGISLERAVTLWARRIALPGGLLLGAAAVALLLVGRLESVGAALRHAKNNALQDGLSRLPNRRAFEATFEALGRASLRDKRPLSALFIDIDHFKQLNDHHGHAVGDRALRAVAGAIRGSLLRPTDFCCRWGGEEFVVLLPDTDTRGALQTAQRVIERARRLRVRVLGGHEQGITVSVGVATHSDAGDAIHELVMHADQAMLEAKRAGRDRWVVWRAASTRLADDEPPPPRRRCATQAPDGPARLNEPPRTDG
jgi:diguanylate cyclase (GGDEF)-like protein